MWNVINHALSARRRVRRDLALLKRSLNWARRGRLSIRIYLLCQIIFRNCDKFSDYFLFDFLACIQFVGLTVLYSDKQKCISLKKKKGSANRTIFHFFSHWLTLFYFDISYSHFIAIIAFFFLLHTILYLSCDDIPTIYVLLARMIKRNWKANSVAALKYLEKTLKHWNIAEISVARSWYGRVWTIFHCN